MWWIRIGKNLAFKNFIIISLLQRKLWCFCWTALHCYTCTILMQICLSFQESERRVLPSTPYNQGWTLRKMLPICWPHITSLSFLKSSKANQFDFPPFFSSLFAVVYLLSHEKVESFSLVNENGWLFSKEIKIETALNLHNIHSYVEVGFLRTLALSSGRSPTFDIVLEFFPRIYSCGSWIAIMDWMPSIYILCC